MMKLSTTAKLSFSLAFTVLVSPTYTEAKATRSARQDGSPTALTISSSSLINSFATQLLAQQRQSRVALVVGNANYIEDPLDNPVNDATDIAAALRTLGFEVTLLLDQDLRSMENALEGFYQQLQQGSIGAFYYAGHGAQAEGENYLIPLGASLTRQSDVRYEALALGRVLDAMEESESQVNLIIVDACRDNPFYRRWRSGSRSRSVERGLASEIPPEGTILSFSTGPGNVADDGKGRNSPYTASLLRHILNEGEDIAAMFRRVRTDVIRETDGKQRPWYTETLVGSFSLNPSEDIISSAQQQETAMDENSVVVVPQQSQPSSGTISSENATGLRPHSPFINRPGTSQPIQLSSVRGVSYQPLRDALAAGNLLEADTLTTLLLAEGGYVSDYFLEQACEDLRIIDSLWSFYSDGRFGIKSQYRLYQEVGGTRAYDRIAIADYREKVGWVEDFPGVGADGILDPFDAMHFDSTDLIFSYAAPVGHFPHSMYFDSGAGGSLFRRVGGSSSFSSSGWFIFSSAVERCNL
ncbi:GUN4-like family [Synechococcus sp. PCC 7335]|uniref:caspase family protein n=1 Tax=Synechococcus sp. (strain ATCC 29403 / PCC 7335) TaxID=91464 RepID=UPI00017EC499|nr:caspase family protein [Synechococcus sp. PCC 7335]EDX82332.1 GUN4-like family [Synechococcus sp. PCC 7335]